MRLTRCKETIIRFILVIFSLVYLVGCSEPTQSDLSQQFEGQAIQGATDVSSAVYAAVEQLADGTFASAVWAELSQSDRQALWATVVRNVSYPETEPYILRTQTIELTQPVQDGSIPASGIAWLPTQPTVAAATSVVAAIAPDLPDTVQNYFIAPNDVTAAAVSDLVGFNLDSAEPLDIELGQAEVPLNTAVYISPVVIFNAVEFSDAGTAYQYDRLLVITFATSE